MPRQRRGRRFPVKLRESAATAERVELRESPTARPENGGKGEFLAQLITEGWGSSGYYRANVLERAAQAKTFHKGLPLYMDHPRASDEDERPERSVLEMAAVLVEDARYEPSRKGLVARAKPLPTYRHLLTDKDFVEAVGLSIRAGGLAEHGEAEGRHGLIVSEIRNATSVDFVTRAGRGGKVLALLESARIRLREAPTEQTRAAIERAVRTGYVLGEDRYAWVRDYDPERGVVWFETGGRDVEPACWEQAYAGNGTGVTLIGPRRQVVAETVYRPVAAEYVESAAEVAALRAQNPDPANQDPGGTPPAETTTTKEGPAMSGDQTGGTPASAGTTATTEFQAREAALTTERDTALREAQAAQRELARYKAAEQAAPIVDRILAESGLPTAAVARVRTGVLGQVPLTEAGALDETRLRSLAEAETTAEKAYLAQLAEAAGAGKVSGFGATSAPAQPADVSPWAAAEPEPDAALVESYRRRGLNAEAALAAARGRSV